MTDSRNKLPVAVNVVAGGAVSKRAGGSVAALSGVTGGSFALGTATGFRLQPNFRSSGANMAVVVGYTSPVSFANAEYVLGDKAELRDSVPAGLTLYFALFDPVTLESAEGGACDYLALTRYE